jgi:PAS domain-containing protein
MPAAGWMRRWRGGRGAEDQASAPVLAAARGEPLNQLLSLGARVLLAATGADRAGLWLLGDRRGESRTGYVVEAVAGPVPEQWKRLDVSTPSLRAALENPNPLQVEYIDGDTTPHLGPLIGMHSAVWIPLRERDRTFGLAMVGYGRPPGELDLDALRARADEITLAIQHHLSSRRSELAAEERRAQLRLSRAILCGVSADSILPRIARAARHYGQAEFVALGRGSAPPFAGEGWDGAAEWLATLHQESLLQLWSKVLKEGRDSEIPGEALTKLSLASTEVPHSVLDRVVAIPIEVRSETRGILMAGLLRSEESGEDFLRMESYALLAASALDREAAREERTASHEILRNIIEDSRECLIVIDGEGKILEANRAAAMLLFTSRGRKDGTLLEELFSPVARDAVTEWRGRLPSLAPAPLQKKAEERGFPTSVRGGTRSWRHHSHAPPARDHRNVWEWAEVAHSF